MTRKIRVVRKRKDFDRNGNPIRQGYWILAEKLRKGMQPFSKKVVVAGSIRRRSENINDIDIVVIPKDKEAIRRFLERKGNIVRSGEDLVSVEIGKIPVDIFFTNPGSFGASLMTATGPAGGNISNRSLAKSKGLKLNRWGLFRNGKKIAGSSERDIYRKLGKSYRIPEDRGKPRQ